MASKDTKEVKELKQETNTTSSAPKTLPPRIHINEFIMLHTNLDDMQKAGFKAICKKEWMRKEEWQEQLNKYLGK
jgi:hypothetical protein